MHGEEERRDKPDPRVPAEPPAFSPQRAWSSRYEKRCRGRKFWK